MSFYQIMPMEHTKYALHVEQGKNMDRSDACDLWFLFQFLKMSFSAMNFKAHKNFVILIKNT